MPESLFNKVAGLGLQLYQNRDFGMDVFLWILWHFSDHSFLKIHLRWLLLYSEKELHKQTSEPMFYKIKNSKMKNPSFSIMTSYELQKWWKTNPFSLYQNIINKLKFYSSWILFSIFTFFILLYLYEFTCLIQKSFLKRIKNISLLTARWQKYLYIQVYQQWKVHS